MSYSYLGIVRGIKRRLPLGHDGAVSRPAMLRRTASSAEIRDTVRAMLEGTADTRCQLRTQHPAPLCRADETQKGHTRISDQLLCRGNVAGDKGTPPIGQARLSQNIDEIACRQRCIVGGFDDHGTTDGHRRCHLV